MSYVETFRSAVEVDVVEYGRSAFESEALFDTEFDTNVGDLAVDASAIPILDAFAQNNNDVVQDPNSEDPAVETQGPRVNQQATLSGSNNASNMKQTVKVETGKAMVANVNSNDLKANAFAKRDAAQADLAEMRAQHHDMQAQNSPEGNEDPSSPGGGGSVAGQFAKDTAVGCTLAGAAEAIAPGTGAVVAATTTIASSCQIVGKMVAAGTNEARNGGELSTPIISDDGPGVRRNEAAQVDVMAMDSGPTSQKVWNTMSQGPGFGSAKVDEADCTLTHDRLEGILQCPFEETPEAQACMEALHDGVEAVNCHLSRESEGINPHEGAEMALAKGVTNDGSAGSVLDREDELRQFAAPKVLDPTVI
jgi:hypothetical protein